MVMWLHECERTYGDRLVNKTDFSKYRASAADLTKKMFGKFNVSKFFQAKNPEPIVFCHFAKGFQDSSKAGKKRKEEEDQRLLVPGTLVSVEQFY